MAWKRSPNEKSSIFHMNSCPEKHTRLLMMRLAVETLSSRAKTLNCRARPNTRFHTGHASLRKIFRQSTFRNMAEMKTCYPDQCCGYIACRWICFIDVCERSANELKYIWLFVLVIVPSINNQQVKWPEHLDNSGSGCSEQLQLYVSQCKWTVTGNVFIESLPHF